MHYYLLFSRFHEPYSLYWSMDCGRSGHNHCVVQDPTLVIWVGVVTFVAQQVDSNLITPNVMGKTLEIHPLTVITIILAAGNIAGFLGIIVAIPTYAVGKAIVKNIYAARLEIKNPPQRQYKKKKHSYMEYAFLYFKIKMPMQTTTGIKWCRTSRALRFTR